MNKYIKNLVLTLLGILITVWIIWARFIRERLPKDIPFQLTEYRVYFLLYICCIYFFIIVSLLRNPNKNSTFGSYMKKVSDYIYHPLIILDLQIKTNIFPLSATTSFLEHLSLKTNPFKTRVIDDPTGILAPLYIIFNIIPRLLLSTLLLLDIFYFKKIDHFYHFILIGLIPLTHRYLKFSLKNVNKILSQDLSSISMFAKEDYLDAEFVQTNDQEAIDEALSKKFQYHNQEISIETYLEMMKDGSIDVYDAFPRVHEQFNESSTAKKSQFYDHNINYRRFCYLSQEYSDMENLWFIKTLRILAFSLYLFAWSYVLVKSFHSLEGIPLTKILIKNFSYHLFTQIMSNFY